MVLLFNGDPAGFVNTVQQYACAVLREIFIYCFAGALPVAIVVYDQHTTLLQARK
jgi:hypothetical protein